MKWEIRHGLRQYTLFNEAHKKIMGIHKKGGAYLITDASGQNICRLEHETPAAIRLDGAFKGFAEIKFSEQKSIFIPPRAESAELSLSNSAIRLHQTQKRDFVISENNENVGMITKALKINPRIDISDAFSADTVAIIYTLVLIMLREDDIDIV